MRFSHYVRNKINSIKTKIAFIIVICFLIVVSVFLIHTLMIARQQAINSTREQALLLAADYSSDLHYGLQTAVNKAKTIANVFSAHTIRDNQFSLNRNEAIAMMREVLIQNNDFFGVCTAWEPDAFDKLDTMYQNQYPYQNDGRFTVYLFKDAFGGIENVPLEEYDDEETQWYQLPKRNLHTIITEPYFYPVGNKKVLMTTVSSPILTGNQFKGIVTIDIKLEKIQEYVRKMRLYNEKIAVQIISNNGIIVAASPDKDLTGRDIRTMFYDAYERLSHIRAGRKFVNQSDSAMEVCAPLRIIDEQPPWQIRMVIPNSIVDTLQNEIRNDMLLSIIIGGLLICFFIVLIIWFINKLIKPLDEIAGAAKKLAKGNLKVNDVKTTGIEIDRINEAFQKIRATLKEKATVLETISKGDYSKKTDVGHANDVLSRSINKMVDALKKAGDERKKRKKEDEIRTWTAQGLANFSDILRQHSDDLERLSKETIKELVHYIDANQGGIFLVNDELSEKPFIEQTAAFAYNRQRKIQKRIEWREGLIGRCIDEKNTIHIREVPEGYINITSGLGDETPDSLLIVPMIFNEVVVGAIEMATFGRFEEYKIRFIEELAEDMASTISRVKNSLETNRLLNDSQKQTERLAQQEEELRQNLEELKATQEESAKREAEMNSILIAIEQTALVVEYDMKGNIIQANESYQHIFEMSEDDLIGKKHEDFVVIDETEKHDYQEFWNDLKHGQTHKRISRLNTGKREIWLSEIYSPILDKNEMPYKILSIASDITESKLQEQAIKAQSEEMKRQEEEIRLNMKIMQSVLDDMAKKDMELRGQLEAINQTDAMIEFDLEGNILQANEIFCRIMGYEQSEVVNQPHWIFVEPKMRESEEYKELWDKLKKGIPTEGEFIRIAKSGDKVYIKGVYYPIKDKDDKPVKVLKLAFDITEQKEQMRRIKSFEKKLREQKRLIGKYEKELKILHRQKKQ